MKSLLLILIICFCICIFIPPIILTVLSFLNDKTNSWVKTNYIKIVKKTCNIAIFIFIGACLQITYKSCSFIWEKHVSEKTKKIKNIDEALNYIRNSKSNFYIISTNIDKKYLNDQKNIIHIKDNLYILITNEKPTYSININDEIIINPHYLIKINKSNENSFLNEINEESLKKLKMGLN